MWIGSPMDVETVYSAPECGTRPTTERAENQSVTFTKNQRFVAEFRLHFVATSSGTGPTPSPTLSVEPQAAPVETIRKGGMLGLSAWRNHLWRNRSPDDFINWSDNGHTGTRAISPATPPCSPPAIPATFIVRAGIENSLRAPPADSPLALFCAICE